MIESLLAILAVAMPSLISVMGIVLTVCTAISKIRKLIEDIKGKDMASAAAAREEAIMAEVAQVVAQNAELTRTNKLLLDYLTKVHGYADTQQ